MQKMISRLFYFLTNPSVKESVKFVSRKFHKKFHGCFKNLSMKFCCSMNLIAATLVEGGLVSQMKDNKETSVPFINNSWLFETPPNMFAPPYSCPPHVSPFHEGYESLPCQNFTWYASKSVFNRTFLKNCTGGLIIKGLKFMICSII